MSMLAMYGKLPSVEDMMAALASPIVPKSSMEVSDEMTLSTDEMIREIFSMMKGHGGVGTNGQLPTAAALDSSYDSSTATYDGLPRTMNYNGGI